MRRFIKWVAGLVGVLLLAAIVVYAVAYFRSEQAMAKTYTVADPPLAIARDADTVARGAHIFITRGCGECHGMQFEGGGPGSAPPLIVAKGYDAEKFARLMRTGITAAGTPSESGLMTEVARNRFVALTDEEVGALHRFLQSR